MKKIWNVINQSGLRINEKRTYFITSMILLSAAIGALIGAIVGNILHEGIVLLICFMGYPAVFVGMIGSVLYLYNHDFT